MLEEREPTEPSLASLIIDEKTVGNARVSSRAYAKPAQNSTELIKNGHVLTPEGRVKEHRTPNSQKNLVTMTTV
ncbi:unnamed protein product [Protopolystoma xenopodis]|uniref:Uncharacterized protein n=1 Tax=Protopolystoma xenopodis TaxID=117903 RepID=A0A448WYC9_9PLAT|nr:unnamed protein product [Protopolystoma xenopodis]